MPLPTPAYTDDFWLDLAKKNYPIYRTLKALKAGRQSAQMIATINALESKLAVRGQIPFGLPSTDIVTTARSIKAANAPANGALAKAKLDSLLSAKAIPLQKELELLAGYIISKGPPGAKWIDAPLKTLDKAMSKTKEDYDYAWTLNKDLVRGTIVTNTDHDLSLIAGLMMQTCTAQHGMFLIKKEHQKSVRDGGEVKSGYSGWNFAIQFKDHNAFGVELQANTVDMMYGKMSKKDFFEKLKVSEAAYVALQNKHKFPGGLQHALYDIQDVARSKATPEEGNLARELCLDYNDACRGQFRNTTLEDLNKRIQEFGGKLTTAKARELWTHVVDGSGWKAYPFVLIGDYKYAKLHAETQRTGRIVAAGT